MKHWIATLIVAGTVGPALAERRLGIAVDKAR
jgi:hypothetical protein